VEVLRRQEQLLIRPSALDARLNPSYEFESIQVQSCGNCALARNAVMALLVAEIIELGKLP
jgi:hypothetical protein